MTIPRLFQKIELEINQTVELSLDAAHYFGNVRRAREGDALILFNGEGGEYAARILTIKKEKFTVKVESFHDVSRESPLTIHLAQGIARGEKMDWIIQKAVELGVKKIIPLSMERSTVKLDAERREKRQQHWQAVAMSACEQSGRNRVPEISTPVIFTEWIKKFTGVGIVLSPYSENKISDLNLESGSVITLLIGPEGGLSEMELKIIEQKKWLSMQLGPRILRTETAPLAAIAALQSRFGDLG